MAATGLPRAPSTCTRSTSYRPPIAASRPRRPGPPGPGEPRGRRRARRRSGCHAAGSPRPVRRGPRPPPRHRARLLRRPRRRLALVRRGLHPAGSPPRSPAVRVAAPRARRPGRPRAPGTPTLVRRRAVGPAARRRDRDDRRLARRPRGADGRRPRPPRGGGLQPRSLRPHRARPGRALTSHPARHRERRGAGHPLDPGRRPPHRRLRRPDRVLPQPGARGGPVVRRLAVLVPRGAGLDERRPRRAAAGAGRGPLPTPAALRHRGRGRPRRARPALRPHRHHRRRPAEVRVAVRAVVLRDRLGRRGGPHLRSAPAGRRARGRRRGGLLPRRPAATAGRGGRPALPARAVGRPAAADAGDRRAVRRDRVVLDLPHALAGLSRPRGRPATASSQQSRRSQWGSPCAGCGRGPEPWPARSWAVARWCPAASTFSPCRPPSPSPWPPHAVAWRGAGRRRSCSGRDEPPGRPRSRRRRAVPAAPSPADHRRASGVRRDRRRSRRRRWRRRRPRRRPDGWRRRASGTIATRTAALWTPLPTRSR